MQTPESCDKCFEKIFLATANYMLPLERQLHRLRRMIYSLEATRRYEEVLLWRRKFISLEQQIIYSHMSDEAVRSIMTVIHPTEGRLCVGALITESFALIPKSCMEKILNNINGIYALVGLLQYVSGNQHYFAKQNTEFVHDSLALGELREDIVLTTYLELALPTSVIGGLISLGMDSSRHGSAVIFNGITQSRDQQWNARTASGIHAQTPIACGSLLLYRGRLVGLADSFLRSVRNQEFSLHRFSTFDQCDFDSNWYSSINPNRAAIAAATIRLF